MRIIRSVGYHAYLPPLLEATRRIESVALAANPEGGAMSDQSLVAPTRNALICTDCQGLMMPSQLGAVPGLTYFGHRMFQCDGCGKVLVIANPR
jgi:hypothetical protein